MDELRLLGKSGGYTHKSTHALRVDGALEPEAVDAETQRRITKAAAEGWPHLDALHRGERESKPLATRIAHAKAQAKHLRVDVYQPLRLLEMAMLGGRSHAHIERRVQALEATVFPSHDLR